MVSRERSCISACRRWYFSSSCAFGIWKSGKVSRIWPRSMPTTLRPASASSFAMIVPVTPTPTSTTSTGFSFVAIAVSSILLRQEHVLRVAVLVHSDLLVLHVGDGDGLGRVGHVVPVDEIAVGSRHARKAHQLPADLVA